MSASAHNPRAGKEGGNTFGSRHQMKHGHYGVLNWFIRRALDGQPIELYGGGKQTRDYTFVEDAADAFRLAILKLPLDGQHFLVGSPFEASMRQVADLVVAACGQGTVVDRPYPPGVKEIEVLRYLTSFGKFRSATGWEPRVPLAEGVARTVAWFRAEAGGADGGGSRTKGALDVVGCR
ncbi:MAG TPA: NAD-dependent epimerase/dehydratase family protein [Candidatus Thermoplasmatota archaeon]